MKLLHNDDTNDLEAELRALLRRRSADLNLDPPDWQDLVERPRAVVFSLHTGDGKNGKELGPWRHRPKPVFIAAAAVVVVLAGGVAARSVTAPDSAGLEESPASFSAAAPSDAGFDAHTAPAVYASNETDPLAAAQSYLAQTGVSAAAPATPATPGQPSLELLSDEGGVAVVQWTSLEGSVSRTGTVFLRTNPVEQAESTVGATWSVVGSTIEGVALTDVAYDGEQLSFTVTKTADLAGPLAVSVWSNGEQIAVDGDAVQAAAGSAGDVVGAGAATEDGNLGAGAAADGESLDGAAATEAGDVGAGADGDSVDAGAATEAGGAGAGAGGDSVDAGAAAGGNAEAEAAASASDGVDADASANPAGQLVEIGDEVGSAVPLTAVVDEASTAVIRIQQLVDGQPASVADMAVAPPGADASAGADVAGSGSADSDVDVNADVDGHAEPNGRTSSGPGVGPDLGQPLDDAGEAVEGLVEGGTTIPLPGGHEATTPSLPTTLPPIPTTLPAPPSGGDLP